MSLRAVSAKLEIASALQPSYIDATTGYRLCVERYDGQLVDIFALEDEVLQQIVATLAVKLTEGE